MKPSSILLFLGALLVTVAVLTSHWTSEGGSDYAAHSGLFRMVMCDHDRCDSMYMIKFIGQGGGGRVSLGIIAGLAAVLCGLAGAVLAVITGFAAGKTRRGPAMIALILTAVAAGVSLAFLLLTGSINPMHWGFSTPAMLVGAALAITGAALAMKAAPLARPSNFMAGMPMGMMPPMGMQPGYMAPPAHMVPMTPPCNQCGGQTQFVQQYGKLFCGRCNRYIV